MVEATQQLDPYLEQLEEVEDETVKTSLQTLYDAGYVDFEENKIMIESNPGMSMDDVMVCIDESKKDDDGTNLEDLSDDKSSDAAAGELNENDIAEMNALVGNVLDSATDPETDDKVDEEN